MMGFETQIGYIFKDKLPKQIKKIVKTATPIFCIVLVFVIILNTVIIPGINYKKGVKLMDDGDYRGAIVFLHKSANYKDSEKLRASILNEIGPTS